MNKYGLETRVTFCKFREEITIIHPNKNKSKTNLLFLLCRFFLKNKNKC